MDQAEVKFENVSLTRQKSSWRHKENVTFFINYQVSGGKFILPFEGGNWQTKENTCNSQPHMQQSMVREYWNPH